MPFYKRGFLYLIRKRGKSVLLLLIFLFVNSMILSTNTVSYTHLCTSLPCSPLTGITDRKGVVSPSSNFDEGIIKGDF